MFQSLCRAVLHRVLIVISLKGNWLVIFFILYLKTLYQLPRARIREFENHKPEELIRVKPYGDGVDKYSEDHFVGEPRSDAH